MKSKIANSHESVHSNTLLVYCIKRAWLHSVSLATPTFTIHTIMSMVDMPTFMSVLIANKI